MAEQLRGEPWFHGKLSRREAEALLQLDGDFLVRESTTTPGQYVLTGLQSGQPKHLLLVDPEGVVSEAGPRVGWPKGSHSALPAACPGIPPPASPAGRPCMGLPALGVPSTAARGLGVPSFSSPSLNWVPFSPGQSSHPQT